MRKLTKIQRAYVDMFVKLTEKTGSSVTEADIEEMAHELDKDAEIIREYLPKDVTLEPLPSYITKEEAAVVVPSHVRSMMIQPTANKTNRVAMMTEASSSLIDDLKKQSPVSGKHNSAIFRGNG